MNSEGQVYFDAGDKTTPQEDFARYEKACQDEDLLATIREHYRQEAEEARRRDREPTDKQRAHIEKRTRFEDALRAEAEARWGSGKQEKE